MDNSVFFSNQVMFSLAKHWWMPLKKMRRVYNWHCIKLCQINSVIECALAIALCNIDVLYSKTALYEVRCMKIQRTLYKLCKTTPQKKSADEFLYFSEIHR